MDMEQKTKPADQDTDWLIDDDIPAADSELAAPPWRVLIVDDDVDVHVVTKFALSNTIFMGRRLSYLHAYTSEEALALLREHADIAVVLLDVIMESNDSGLRLTRRIRDELGNKLVRIILRTGQPGQALEHRIMAEYDVNDFWCKTDLSTRKLFTTLISSLRSYASLINVQQRAATLAAALEKSRQVENAIAHYALTLTLDRGGRIISINPQLCQFLQYEEPALAGQPVGLIHPAAAAPAPGASVSSSLSSSFSHAVAQGNGWSGAIDAQASDGSLQRLRVMLLPLNDNETLYIAMPDLDA